MSVQDEFEYLRGLIRGFRENKPALIDRKVETDMIRLISMTNFPPSDPNKVYEPRISSLEADALGTLATSTLAFNKIITIRKAEYEKYHRISGDGKIADSRQELENLVKSVLLADDIYLFFTLSASLLESISVEMLHLGLISEKHQNSKKSLHFVKNLSQKQRTEFLFRTETIESGLKGEMDRIREIRNDLTHEVRQRFLQDSIENLEDEIRRGIRAVNRLHENYNGVKPLGWVDEGN